MRVAGDWLWAVLVWLDQGINTIAGPLLNKLLDPLHLFGDPDETLSSVTGKNVRDGTCRGCYWFCRLVHMLDPDHCTKSIEENEGSTRPVHQKPEDVNITGSSAVEDGKTS